jgi:exopolysaccharide biosynthesis polyprenyl glycosylphosphotransferase
VWGNVNVGQDARDLGEPPLAVPAPGEVSANGAASVTTLPLPLSARMRARRVRRALVRRALVASDALAFAAALVLAHALVPATAGTAAAFAPYLLAVPAWVALAAALGLYDGQRVKADESALDDVWPLFHTATLGIWGLVTVAHVTRLEDAPMGWALAAWALAVAFAPTLRAGARAVVRRQAAYRERTVIVGAGLVGQEIARKLRANPRYGLDVVGFVDADPLPLHRELEEIPVLGGLDDLAAVIRRRGIEHVVLAFTGDGHQAGLDVVRACHDLGVHVDIVPRLFEVVGTRARVAALQGTPLLGLTMPALGASHRIAKRAMDVVGAAAGLAVLAPLLAAVAVAVKLTSPGPVFFRQPRIGRGQRPFTILKFRTMVEDADQRKAEVAHLNAHLSLGDARMFKIPDDPRVTALGQILRRLSIDELPQLWNVLRGDMSLVGPRPLILDEHQYVTSWGLRRLDLTPGLTGLWQVCGRSEIPFSQMLVLDYLYVTNWSLWGDIKLVFRTIPVLFGKTRGAA